MGHSKSNKTVSLFHGRLYVAGTESRFWAGTTYWFYYKKASNLSSRYILGEISPHSENTMS